MRVTLICFIFQFMILPGVGGQSWEIFNSENSVLPDGDVNALFIDEFGGKWFGTNKGLVYYSSGTWKAYTEIDNLANDIINDIAGLRDLPEPKLYISTPGGVSEIGYDADGLTGISSYNSSNSGLTSDSITTIALDTGRLLYIASNKGLDILREESWLFLNQYISEDGAVSLQEVNSMVISPDGWSFAGTSDQGVARLRMDVDGITGASAYSTEWSGLLTDHINDIHMGASGNQWYATDKGLAYHEGYQTKDNWETYTELSSGLISNNVLAVTVDAQGVVWSGCDKGISRFDGSEWLSFSEVNGLSGFSVFDIEVDTDQTIWFASDKGVLHFDESGFPDGLNQRKSIEELRLDVFPTIVSNVLSLNYAAPLNSRIEIFMMDMNGNIIHRFGAQSGSGDHDQLRWFLMDAGKQIAPGLYMICLKTEMGTISKKILIFK